MKQLYKETDNKFIIQYHILPYLHFKICQYHKLGDLNALSCVDKNLNKIVGNLKYNCKKIKSATKTVCEKHCKALPIYRHIQRVYDSSLYSHSTYIHFNYIEVANIFKDLYDTSIARHRGRLHSCCRGKGYRLISSLRRPLARPPQPQLSDILGGRLLYTNPYYV